MSESPTILKAFDVYEENVRNKSFYLGPVNSGTVFAPASVINYCDNGDIWLGRGWYARKKPTRKCQVRITSVEGKLTVVMPQSSFVGMSYRHCLNIHDMWKVQNLHFITSW